MPCEHKETDFYKFTCSNGALQVRQICRRCGVNVRGTEHVPHQEIWAIGKKVKELPDLPKKTDDLPGQLTLFEDMP